MAPSNVMNWPLLDATCRCLNCLMAGSLTHPANSRNSFGLEQAMYPETRGPHSVEEVIAQAHRELLSLLEQRMQIVQRIGAIKQTISGLANLFGEEVLDDSLLELIDRKPGNRRPGLTRTCRAALMESVLPLTPQNMCDEVRRRRPDLLAHHKSPVASVTTVMNRLVRYGEARMLRTASGRRAWQWAASNEVEIVPVPTSAHSQSLAVAQRPAR